MIFDLPSDAEADPVFEPDADKVDQAKACVKATIDRMSKDELLAALQNHEWRLRHLYWIVDKQGDVVLFKPNEHQQRFIDHIWFRNIILKARQLGFSTVVQMLMLDTCLFNPNITAAVIADTEPNATKIFRKIKFAYDMLPYYVLEMRPLLRDSASELILSNNSNLQVAVSARSGTLQFLHISEFGKICARHPGKAREIVAGSLPAVVQTGVCVIESTAEGRDGPFYEMTTRAEALALEGKKLSRREYRFHFAPWWTGSEYRTDPNTVTISGKDHDYFNRVETLIGRDIEPDQRAWYIATRDNDFGGDSQLMKQEYPSTPQEAFEQSIEGVYYAEQLSAARRTGRILDLPHDPSIPVNTFWDLGKNNSTCIWFHQSYGPWDHWINFFEASDQPFSFFTQHMQSLGYTWGTHYLPHDGEHRSWGVEQLKTAEDMLYELGLRNIQIVPRTPNIGTAIRQCQDAFPRYRFDATRCKEGIRHLENYRKQWNERLGAWSDQPMKNGHDNAADALRQHAQVFQEPTIAAGSRRSRRPSGMAV